jgi:hypothetical protein
MASAPTSLDSTDIKAIRERVQAKIASLNGTNARVGEMLSKTVGAPVEVSACPCPDIKGNTQALPPLLQACPPALYAHRTAC